MMSLLPTIKRCTKCERYVELTGFYVEKRTRVGLNSWCKRCFAAHQRDYYVRSADAYRERSRRWRADNPERVRENSRRAILRGYGLTPDEFDELSSNGCHVCGGRERLCVDHDHSTGEVRGVLCSNCNKCLGLLGEDPDRIVKLAEYLRTYKQFLGG